MAGKNSLTKGKKAKADALARENRLEEALDLYKHICRDEPGDAEAWIKVSAIQRRMGRFDEARESGYRAVRLQPGLAMARYAFGIALHVAGRLEEAIKEYQAAVRLKPDFAVVHYLAGNALRALGRPADAVTSYKQSLALQPDLFEAMTNLGAVLIELSRTDEAEEILQQALSLRPDSPAILINLAIVAEHDDRLDEAVALYGRALRTRPDEVEAISRLAQLYEKMGRLDEVRSLVERGRALSADHPMLMLAEALLARREKRTADAIQRLEAIDDNLLGLGPAGEIRLLLGQLYDKQGDAKQAYASIIEGKRRLALAGGLDVVAAADRYVEKIRKFKSHVSDALVEAAQRDHDPAADAPVFVVGFPRSGTTLLEQILDCHPALQTLDERPAAEAMERRFLDWSAEGQVLLADLTPDQAGELRRIYWEEVKRYRELRPGAVLVDKLPLNLVRIPLIYRVFPQARFILALRHPCDACLSCLMQHFAHNEAMAGFMTLEGTVRIYAEVMSLWQTYIKVLPLRQHQIRYEDLISNFDAETGALLEFLGVGWNDAVREYAEHARQRGVINTPSYHQVTQPIYREAENRWRRYAEHFAPLLPGLEPFIRDFGYLS